MLGLVNRRLNLCLTAVLALSSVLGGCATHPPVPPPPPCNTPVATSPEDVLVTFDQFGNSSPSGLYSAPGIGLQQGTPAAGQTAPPAPFYFPVAVIDYGAHATHGTSDDLTVTAADTFPVAPPAGSVLLNGDRLSTSGWSIKTGKLDAGFNFDPGLVVRVTGPTLLGLGNTAAAAVYTDGSQTLGFVNLDQVLALGNGCTELLSSVYGGVPFAPAANSTYYIMIVRATATPTPSPTPQGSTPFTITNGANDPSVPAIAGISAASNISFGVTAGANLQAGIVSASTQNWAGLPPISGKAGIVYLTVQYSGTGPVTLVAQNPPTFFLTANIVGTAFTAGTTYFVQSTLAPGVVQSIVAIPSTFPGVPGGEVDFASPLAGFSWNPNQPVGIVIAQ